MSCQFRTKRSMKNGTAVNCCDNSDRREANQNKCNINGQNTSCDHHVDFEVKDNSKENPCNNCSNETDNKNMCDHADESETCRFHSNHRKNSESTFGDGFTNIRCKFCWYINRIHSSEIKEAQKCFQTDIKCMYCSNDVSIKHLVPKSGISHPYCKRCQITAGGITQGPFSHTDCKYCQSSCINKKSQRQRSNFPHTDCKYCHDTNCESTDSSFEECDDMYHGYRYIPCTAHDVPYRYSRYYPHYGKPFPFRYNSYSHEDSPDIDYIRETLRGINLSSTFQMGENFNFDADNIERSRFRSCEYCLKNGESAVIYNSHQFQNTSGIVTCPLVRQYGTVRDLHYCPHHNENFITSHAHDTLPYNNGCVQRSGPDLPHFYQKRGNGRFRYSF